MNHARTLTNGYTGYTLDQKLNIRKYARNRLSNKGQ